MALTLHRWLVLATLGSAAIGVALLPPTPRKGGGNEFYAKLPSRMVRLSAQLAQAQQQLEIARVGAAVQSHLREHPLPGGALPVVLPVGEAPEEIGKAYADRLAREWPRVPLDNSMAIGLVLGGSAENMVWQSRHLLPSATNPHSCISLIPTATWLRPEWVRDDFGRRLASEVGPCIFFGMYGRPGPGIETWMNGDGLDFATYFNPLPRSPGTPMDAGSDTLMLSGLFEMEWVLYGRDLEGRKCLAGQITECAAIVLRPPSAGTTGFPQGFRSANPPWRADLGSITGAFLSDLHQKIGPRAFERFWRSKLPFEEAFEQATGTTVGQWTYDWAAGVHRSFRPGPLPRQRSVVRVAGLLVLLLGVAITLASRQRP